jgi:putative ubiquitin-RnfH superfamily antitoxin RatB of RatAB toxin-antitoxin module
MSGVVRVEVVFALPLRQDVSLVELCAGASVREAIERSGVLTRHPGIDLSRVGIWGRRCALEDAVRDGDRVELYRPLVADPKEVRRQRAGRRRRA